MRGMLKALFFAVVLVVAGLAQAGEGSTPKKGIEQQATFVHMGEQRLSAEMLPEVRGNAKLTKDEFAREVGRELAQYSAKTKTEACAKLCRAADGVWGAAPLSVGAHVVCPMTNHCPADMSPMAEGIHSHPTGDDYRINSIDKAVLPGPFYKVGAREKRGNPDEFSPEDFAGGDGYMITDRGHLWHQAGPHAVRSLGWVEW